MNLKGSGIRWLLYAALVAMLALHNDVWFWDDPSLVLGLPVGLTYHIGFCIAAAVLMFLLQRFAWPAKLEVGDEVTPGAAADEEGGR